MMRSFPRWNNGAALRGRPDLFFSRLVADLDFLLHAFHLDGAVLQHRNDRAHRRQHRREEYANDTGGQRELGDRSGLVLDDDSAHVPCSGRGAAGPGLPRLP